MQKRLSRTVDPKQPCFYLCLATVENPHDIVKFLVLGGLRRGGLCRFDMTPKPAFHMLKKLFREEWHTEAETVTDDGGWAGWNGFWGMYDCEITADGKTTVVPVHLTKKSGNRTRIVLGR